MTRYVDDDLTPFTQIAYIESRFGQDWKVGSGVLVGRNDVLTASHVIYDIDYGLADEVKIRFSYNPNEFSTSYSAVNFNYYPEFDPDGDGLLYAGDNVAGTLGHAELDIALLTLDTAIGDSLGWMGLDFGYFNGPANVTGHPGLYDHFMVSDEATAARDLIDDFIDISAFEINGGNSGGPVWYADNSGAYVVGVVATGAAAASVSGHEWLIAAIESNNRFLPDGGGAIVYGTSGNDVFAAVSGRLYEGDGGIDTLDIAGRRGAFDISLGTGDTVRITGAGTYDLVSVERAAFDDGVLLFDLDGPNTDAVYRLYAAAFGRTPDEGGLRFWVDATDGVASGAVSPLLADEFLTSPEFARLYGTAPSATVYIDAMYQNVLDRPADGSGYDYWVGRMNNGAGRDDILVAFAESAENRSNTAPDLSDGVWVV